VAGELAVLKLVFEFDFLGDRSAITKDGLTETRGPPTVLPCSFHFFRQKGVLCLELPNSPMSQCYLPKGFM
jgi:hypothetical protein